MDERPWRGYRAAKSKPLLRAKPPPVESDSPPPALPPATPPLPPVLPPAPPPLSPPPAPPIEPEEQSGGWRHVLLWAVMILISVYCLSAAWLLIRAI